MRTNAHWHTAATKRITLSPARPGRPRTRRMRSVLIDTATNTRPASTADAPASATEKVSQAAMSARVIDIPRRPGSAARQPRADTTVHRSAELGLPTDRGYGVGTGCRLINDVTWTAVSVGEGYGPRRGGARRVAELVAGAQ